MSKKVLVLCHDTIGKKMAGPGIRYKKIADHLSKVCDVTLAVYSDDLPTGRKNSLYYINKQDDSFKDVFGKQDIIFAQWLRGDMLDYAKNTYKAIVFDFYAPVPVEYLASLGFSNREMGANEDLEFSGIIETYTNYLTKGDLFVCSNDRQRDFWLGYAVANKLVIPSNFKNSALGDRIALCPMGIDTTSPKPSKLLLREKLGISKNDFVLLWTGGIWDWFDAQVVIKAVNKLKDRNVKLVFLGTKHPNDIYDKEMDESTAARKIAQDLGMVDKSVFFMDGWVPYDDRAAYFMDADVAIYADKESLESRFSHRTRVLDHIWTELPTICNAGDYMAEVVEKYNFGLVVGKRTEDEFAEAISKMINNKKQYEEIKSSLRLNKKIFTWESSLSPLIEYVKSYERPSSALQKTNSRPDTQIQKLTARQRVRGAAKLLVRGQ